MQSLTPLPEENQLFYRTTLYQLVKDGPIGKAGMDMMSTLRKELICSLENSDFPEYSAVVGDLYKVVTDSLVSAVHRSAPHVLINRTSCDYHVPTDEEECQLHLQDSIYGDDEEGVELDSNSDMRSNTRESDQKQRKRDELRKKRREDEEMLLTQRKVMDEKNNAYHTVGPFPAPRLTVRSEMNTFPSRKALQHRTIADSPSPSASTSDDDEEIAKFVVGSSSKCGDAVHHLEEFLNPLSIDSLKKVGESAKAKLKPSSPHEEFVSQIVKTAVRLGCEKACVLMDKQKIIEDMTTHVQAGPLPTTASIDFLNTLPDPLKQSLGVVLGLSDEKPPVEDMWERMVAMGFLSVLTNLRLKPLKKITSELRIDVPDSNSTEKFCETVVFAAFPRERFRAKCSKAKQKKVKFTVPQESMTVKGDMGFISFQVVNISMLTKESERHYSPEFSFAQLKWSLLCMTNKESLALYLCQTGSVHCKFLITVVNHLNPDDSICNEGTQSFAAMSQENDWGFNNVIKFSDLMNPAQGFLSTSSDSITIQVGIVLVEPIKATPVREKPAPAKEKAAPKVDEAALRQLLEDEKAENTRKRIKQDIVKTLKEEEKTRKELTQKANKIYHDLSERLKQDVKRIVKELADRERREEQERQRELEKIRQAQEQSQEMKRKMEVLRRENAELLQDKQRFTQEMKEVKRASDKAANELKSITDKVQATQQRLKSHEKKLEATRHRLEAIEKEEPDTPSSSEDENDFINADLTRLIDEMTVDI